MTTFEKITVSSFGGGQTVKGELVLETPSSWQIAVDGRVRLFEKREWARVSPTSSLFGDVFGSPFGSRF